MKKSLKPPRQIVAIGLAVIWLISPNAADAKTADQPQSHKPTKQETAKHETAIVAGGCFWCVEADFDKVPGVLATISGYIGGHTKKPTYKEVTQQDTGHYEAVKITFDPKKLSYEKLLHIYWRTIDPTDRTGQFCDKGPSYKTAIFVLNTQQKASAEQSKAKEQTKGKLKGQIVTPILQAGTFYKAEAYHQNYYQRNKWRYSYYRTSCGRDRRVKALWGQEAYHGLIGK